MSSTKENWLTLIQEQQESGLPITEFCRNKNIKADNFYYHRSQHLKKNKSSASAFIRAEPTKGLTSIGGEPTQITLYHGTHHLTLPNTISPSWLASLMTALA